VAFDREYSKRDATLIRHKSGRFFRVVALGSRDGTIGCPQNGSTVQPAQDRAVQNDQYRDRLLATGFWLLAERLRPKRDDGVKRAQRAAERERVGVGPTRSK
jgi:hypothetical protein